MKINKRDFELPLCFVIAWSSVWILCKMAGADYRTLLPYVVMVLLMNAYAWKWNDKKSWMENILLISVFKRLVNDKDIPKKIMAGVGSGIVLGGLVMEGVISFKLMSCLPGVLLLIIVIYLMFWNRLSLSEPFNIYSLAGAAVFAFFSATGNTGIFDMYGWSGYLFCMVSWFIMFLFGLESCYGLSEKYKLFGYDIKRTSVWKWGAACFVITCIIDAFFLMVFFPGVMEYDSMMQMFQVFGEPYSNHHPWLHTMIIKGIYELGLSLLGSHNRAFALYCLCSICSMAGTFSVVIMWLARKGMRPLFLVLIGGMYILSPINQMYSIIMWKDIPFGVCVILFIILLMEMCEKKETGRISCWKWVLFVVISFGVCFFRSNGLYMFYGMIPFLFVCFWKHKKEIITSVLVVLILGWIYKGPVFEYYNVTEPDTIESLSIPAQQIAAVIAYDGNISEEQLELLSNIVDISRVEKEYLSSVTCSDAIKDLVRETNNQEYITNHAAEFLRLWGDLLVKNPRIYVKAFRDETAGYWYHQTYFPFIWATYVHENGMGIYRSSQVPLEVEEAVRGYLATYKAYFDQYLSTGLYVYIYFVTLFIMLRKRSRYLVAWLPILGIWGTLLIATPVWADLRYAYSIYLAVPLMTGMCFKSREKKLDM